MEREIDKLKEHFDVRAWLDEAGVAYASSGDNVTQGWVGMRCIYCPDHADHLGINLRSGRFHCWLCGATGDAVTLVRDVEGVPFAVAVERLVEFQAVGAVEAEPERALDARGLLPSGTEPINGSVPEAVRAYLARRRFGEGVIGEYGLMWCGPGGELPLRVVIPVHVGGRLATWQAADVTGRASAKYVSCAKGRSIVNIKDAVYGLDDVAESPLVAVVEGATDRWRCGRRRAVALFGKRASHAQLGALLAGVRRDARLVVMLDADAHEQGRDLAEQLMGARGRGVELVLLAGGDPGAMSEGEVDEILKGGH